MNLNKECCGVLLDRPKAQQHIDRMQRVINKCDEYFSNAVYFSPKFDKLAKELKELSDNDG